MAYSNPHSYHPRTTTSYQPSNIHRPFNFTSSSSNNPRPVNFMRDLPNRPLTSFAIATFNPRQSGGNVSRPRATGSRGDRVRHHPYSRDQGVSRGGYVGGPQYGFKNQVDGGQRAYGGARRESGAGSGGSVDGRGGADRGRGEGRRNGGGGGDGRRSGHTGSFLVALDVRRINSQGPGYPGPYIYSQDCSQRRPDANPFWSDPEHLVETKDFNNSPIDCDHLDEEIETDRSVFDVVVPRGNPGGKNFLTCFGDDPIFSPNTTPISLLARIDGLDYLWREGQDLLRHPKKVKIWMLAVKTGSLSRVRVLFERWGNVMGFSHQQGKHQNEAEALARGQGLKGYIEFTIWRDPEVMYRPIADPLTAYKELAKAWHSYVGECEQFGAINKAKKDPLPVMPLWKAQQILERCRRASEARGCPNETVLCHSVESLSFQGE